ncbi:hypothetical protein AGOR_G00033990 [Albula goreensis]|uniref:C1q domain-containing protein n=1 Tax=Albula goreensis TaxID=1534307 RepID=A0A8T3E063_9TELE|nr:hypothetical protein AGOR_G00033990 [Albula goreensis]
MNVTERNAEAHCFYVEDKLSKQIADEASELRKLLDERLNNMEDQFTTMLVEISNNSLPAVHTGGLEALGHVVNANRYQLQGLEEKLNALGKQCSTDCGAGPRGFDEVLKDVRQYRSDLDTVHADLSVNADRLQDLEAQLQIHQLNSQSLASLQADVASLGGSVRALERYVSDLGESQRDQERELQILNATCCQDCEQEGADGQPGQPGQPVQPGHPAQAPAVNSSQVEELRGRLEELSREVRAELARRREGVPRPEDSGSKPGDVTDSLRRVADTLNRHVSNVWARVQQLHATQRAQTRDMNGLKVSMQSLQAQLTEMADTQKVPVSSPGQPVVRGGGNENLSPPTETKPPPHVPVAPRPGGSLVPHIRIPLIIPHRTPPATVPRIPSPPHSPSSPFSPSIPRQPNALPLPSTPRRPVMETGEAGPPGSEPRIRVSLTQAVSDTKPLQGFAGAPGYPPLNPVSFKPRVVPAAFVPSSRADRPLVTPVSAGGSVVSEPFSFSAGLTTMPFPWHMGIIRFNKVLVNDGGHYSPRTGIFSVPQDGRYLVSAVLTAQRGDRVEGALSVNDRSVQRLSSAGHGSHAPVTARHQVQEPCSCGGSTSINLILHLHHGDRVGVVMTAGKLATSEPKEVLSTFSAIFLYSASNIR